MNPEEHQGSDTAGDSRRSSVYDLTPLLIGRRLSGEEMWATIPVPSDQLLLTQVPGRTVRAEH